MSWRRRAGARFVLEGQVLFAITGRQAEAESWRAARPLNGQVQDEQGLVQAAVVELRRPAQGLGDELVGPLELVQDGRLDLHKTGRWGGVFKGGFL